MKTSHKLLCMLALSFTTIVNAQEKKEMSEEDKAWMAYMTPGKEHMELAKSEGVWTEEMTMWMAPDAPEMKSTATFTTKMILGGRYQQSIHKGSFDGMPFDGISTVGFDNKLKQFHSTWIDNMGTGIMVMTGTWNEEAKAIEFSGTQVDPITGDLLKVREIYTMRDENNHMLEMYMTTVDGREFKSMSINMTRQKATPIKQAPVKTAPVKPAVKK
jgi:Protein of unknown function (DUF1579)